MGWNKTEFQIRDDNRAFVVKTPSGMSTVLLSSRTINFEELSIKLNNWNFYFGLQRFKCPQEGEIILPQIQTDFLCYHFVSKQDIFFFSGSSSSVGRKLSLNITTTSLLSLPFDGISFAISHSSWLANTWWTNYFNCAWRTADLSYELPFPFSENKSKKVSL